MPHYLHETGSEPETGIPYPTRREAHSAKPSTDRTWAITFVANAIEQMVWKEREQNRFTDGTYIAVPWTIDRLASSTGSIYSGSPLPEVRAAIACHYAHLSTSHRGYVAYTPDEAHGCADRQLRIRPGKYLARFASHLPKDLIDHYITHCHARTASDVLTIATSAEDVRRVYEIGPSSCMGGKITDGSDFGRFRSKYGQPKFSGFRYHPSVVYSAPGDLAVAYFCSTEDIRDNDAAITARAVVWPDRKIYSRVYGNDESRLQRIMVAAGYRSGSLDGAKIRRVLCPEFPGSIMLPYIDHHETVCTWDDQFLEISADGDSPRYDSQCTYGYQKPNDHDDRGDDDQCPDCGYDPCECDDRDEANL